MIFCCDCAPKENKLLIKDYGLGGLLFTAMATIEDTDSVEYTNVFPTVRFGYEIVSKDDEFVSAGTLGSSYQLAGYFTYYSKYLTTLIFPMSATDFASAVNAFFTTFLSEVSSKITQDNSLPDADIYISRIVSNNLSELSNLLNNIEVVDLYV